MVSQLHHLSTRDAEYFERSVEGTIPEIISKMYDLVMGNGRLKEQEIDSAMSISIK